MKRITSISITTDIEDGESMYMIMMYRQLRPEPHRFYRRTTVPSCLKKYLDGCESLLNVRFDWGKVYAHYQLEANK